MKVKHQLFFILAAVSFSLITTPATVSGAKYNSSEAKKVRYFQQSYHKLSHKNITENNIYLVQPNFGIPFSAGVLDPEYISSSMAYVNYYRSLAGLPNDSNYETDNLNAQLGAAVLATIDAGQNLQAHGLLGYTRPSYFNKKDWETAENVTLGNINFLESNNGASAGEIVTDLIREDTNIAGAGNIGHRALILSSRATRMGIGAAYGQSQIIKHKR